LLALAFFDKLLMVEDKAVKEKVKVLKITCPVCRVVFWIDAESGDFIKTEKRKKKKSSLDELLLKEKKKKSEADRRFDTTSAMEKEKRKEAQKKFAKAFSDINKNCK
jgi:hypothetical protein